MGGRSSNFKYNFNTGETQTQKSNITPLIDDDNDTISERNHYLVDELQEKHHILCQSTDNFGYDVMTANLAKINATLDKYPQIKASLKNHELNIRGAEFDKTNTVACFSYTPGKDDGMTIFLGKNAYDKNKVEIERVTDNQVNQKSWSPCDKENLINHTIMHEYGHFIETKIINKLIKKDHNLETLNPADKIALFDAYAKKIKHEILVIQKAKFNKDGDFISNYGNRNSKEFFAETFANLVNTKKPTTLARSLEIYIRENL